MTKSKTEPENEKKTKKYKMPRPDITMQGDGPVFYNGKWLMHGQMLDLPKPKKKLLFSEVVYDFKRRHPRLGSNIKAWRGWDYATVRIWLNDGMVLEYNYDEHKAKIIKDGLEEQ